MRNRLWAPPFREAGCSHCQAVVFLKPFFPLLSLWWMKQQRYKNIGRMLALHKKDCNIKQKKLHKLRKIEKKCSSFMQHHTLGKASRFLPHTHVQSLRKSCWLFLPNRSRKCLAWFGAVASLLVSPNCVCLPSLLSVQQQSNPFKRKKGVSFFC